MAVTCPICGAVELKARMIVETIRYGGEELQVPGIAVSVCPSCEEELVTPAQSKANARVFADAKRAHDGLLTSKAIASWREALGLTQAEAARLLGGGVNAFSKYERGEVLQSRAMDLLMRVTMLHPETHCLLRVHAGLAAEPKVTRTVQVDSIDSAWSPSTSVLVGGVFAKERTRLAANDDRGRWEPVEFHYGAC